MGNFENLHKFLLTSLSSNFRLIELFLFYIHDIFHREKTTARILKSRSEMKIHLVRTCLFAKQRHEDEIN